MTWYDNVIFYALIALLREAILDWAIPDRVRRWFSRGSEDKAWRP